MIINRTSPLEKRRQPRKISDRLAARFAPRQPRVVIVNDSAEFCNEFCDLLQDLGLQTKAVTTESEAMSLIMGQEPPDLLVLELDVTAVNRFDFADQLHLRGRETPIIFTAATKDVETIVTALAYYAEDYVVRPLHLTELAVRVQRVLLRTGPLHAEDLEYWVDERLCINFARQYAVINGRQVALTPTENRILRTLYEHRDSAISPNFLLANAWESNHRGSLESLWVHIRRLRNKIEPNPNAPIYIVTVRGRGYRLPGVAQG